MKRFLFPLTILFLFLSCSRTERQTPGFEDPDLNHNRFSNITLEMSLKPFKKNDKQYIEDVCREVFTQWASLLRHADTVSVMLWTADGSEILDYSGNLEQPLEWAKYIGNPNTEHEVDSDPDGNLSIHERAFTYMDDPPAFRYRDLRYIVSQIKKTAEQITGKPVRVGETFDPGPEFAKSAFKYKKHPEVCMGATMGSKTFVCCYATLNADSSSYAGFPGGIAQGTSFGTFFGRQSQHFLTDIGFDYLWLSNGFGFGMETWSATGAVFDGKTFHPEKIEETRSKIIDFWTLFRKECPDFRIETRGTNLSTGIDLAADGVDLRSIYSGGFNILPPPNSPWAAINGDFGLELTGYMSRIAELPDERYLFRYYTHDPWWVNSPWLDRYVREPHDIYLPMAVSRINDQGEVKIPTHLNFLTIDNSYGEMPVQVPDEVTPHILQARRHAPDQPGPVVWVYPFDEYHDQVSEQPERIEEIYYGDWFIRQAVNEGFPLNTVISSTNFVSVMKSGMSLFGESVLVTVVPPAGSELELQLTEFVKNGGKLLVYGPAVNGSREFLELMNLKLAEPLSGEFSLRISMKTDQTGIPSPMALRHDAKMSGGGIETLAAVPDPDTEILAQAFQGKGKRDIAVLRQDPEWKGGAACYVRGTNAATYLGGHLLTRDDPATWFTGGAMMRLALSRLGYSLLNSKKSADVRSPVNCISRNKNAFWFSGYVPNLTVEQRFLFPQGAPVMTGWETEIKHGYATYRFPKAFFEECRVFVDQKEGIISCFEIPTRYKAKRRIQINGLDQAIVRIYAPVSISPENLQSFHNTNYPFKTGKIEPVSKTSSLGDFFEFQNISGQLVVSW